MNIYEKYLERLRNSMKIYQKLWEELSLKITILIICYGGGPARRPPH